MHESDLDGFLGLFVVVPTPSPTRKRCSFSCSCRFYVYEIRFGEYVRFWYTFCLLCPLPSQPEFCLLPAHFMNIFSLLPTWPEFTVNHWLPTLVGSTRKLLQTYIFPENILFPTCSSSGSMSVAWGIHNFGLFSLEKVRLSVWTHISQQLWMREATNLA